MKTVFLPNTIQCNVGYNKLDIASGNDIKCFVDMYIRALY